MLGNAIAGRAAQIASQAAQNQWGIIVGIDAARHRVKVELQPSGVTTSWLPILTTAAGAGWGLSMIPDMGMQVLCVPDAGNAAHLIVAGAAHSTVDQPPLVANALGAAGVASTTTAPQSAGELILAHKSGSVIRMCADGSIYLRGPVKIDGTLTVNGEVFDQHGKLDTLRQAYNGHEHTGVSPGVSTTGPTTIAVAE